MRRITGKLTLCLALTLALSACGEKEKTQENKPKQVKPKEVKPHDGKTDADTDNITCPAGKGGANCDECLEGFFGQDCKPCTCTEHGACNDGKNGNGQCSDCDEGFYGLNCEHECACDDEEGQICDDGIEGFGCLCANNKVGDNCDIEVKCKHGELNPADGHCKKCNGNFDGEDCNECKENFTGEDCNECKENFTGENCDECKN